MAFEGPAADDGPQLSSLCLPRRADRLPADAASSAGHSPLTRVRLALAVLARNGAPGT